MQAGFIASDLEKNTSQQLSVAIAGQQKKLAVELTVKIEARLRHSRSLFRLLPSLTLKVFPGQQFSRSLTVKPDGKAVKKPEGTSMLSTPARPAQGSFFPLVTTPSGSCPMRL
jgi:hypothetical protein